jgi:hypothetical protein
MARQPHRQNFCNVTLFESSPTDDSHFNYPSPSYAAMNRPQIYISSWDDIPEEFRPLPPNLRKPLPPLPSREPESPERSFGPPKKTKSDEVKRRNFWARLRRSKSESHHEPIREVPTWPEQTGFEAPWNFEAPQPRSGPSYLASSRDESSQLVWMPREQMWLVSGRDLLSNASGSAQNRRRQSDELHVYQQPPNSQPVNPGNLSPLSPWDPPPPYWPSVNAGATPTSSTPTRSPNETQWDFMARRLQRPLSAGPY